MAIPKILHFTWKGARLPRRMAAIFERWQALHPDWEFRFYDDAGLRDFVVREFPEHLALYDGYPKQIQRVDVFRYMVLSRVGGIYADLDVEPYQALDALLQRSACFVGVEPQLHMGQAYNGNGLPYLLCNAFMGSEPGHPFWEHVLGWLYRAASPDVLASTGPWFLTGAGLTAPAAARPDVLSADFWSPITHGGTRDMPDNAFVGRIGRRFEVIGHGEAPICSHLWWQTWNGFGLKNFNEVSLLKLPSRLKWRWRKWRHPQIFETAAALLSPRRDYDAQDLVPVDRLPRVHIATPIKNAERFLPRYRQLIEALDYPAELISIGLLVSDSSDRTLELAEEIRTAWTSRFRSVTVTRKDFGFDPGDKPRWAPSLQMQRRGILGACRTELAQQAAALADHCLFVDVDLSELPPGAIHAMLAARRPVVMANCLDEKGAAFDQNAFLYGMRPNFRYIYRHGGLKGLLQPPAGRNRHYLTRLGYLRITPLDAVGGTLLLVDCAVFRAGVVFPATPYKLHIETEGFAIMARDHGFEVCGLPDLKVVHPRH